MARMKFRTRRDMRRRRMYHTILSIAILLGIILFVFPFWGQDEEAETEIIIEVTPDIEESIAEPAIPEKPMPALPEKSEEISSPQADDEVATLIAQAHEHIKKDEIVAARNALNDILHVPLSDVQRENVKKQMQTLAERWLFGPAVISNDPLCGTYQVRPGERLSSIAKKFKIPYQILLKINRISRPEALQAGQVLKVVNGPFHVTIYRSSFTLDLYLQNTYVNSYKVGLGIEGRETPLGLWQAKAGGKLVSPPWTDPDSGRRYEKNDPDYPLGARWIGIEGLDDNTKSRTGFALHGTKDDHTIGTKSSKGCIRLYNGEIIELYNMLAGGYSRVRIVE